MKKLFRIVGVAMMALFGGGAVVVLLQFPGLVDGMEGTRPQNIATGLAMLVVYAGFFWLGLGLYRRGKQEARAKDEPAAAKPATAPKPAAGAPAESALLEAGSVLLYYDKDANRNPTTTLERLSLGFRQGVPCVETIVGWNEGLYGGGAGSVREVPESLRPEPTPERLLAWMREACASDGLEAVNWDDPDVQGKLRAWCEQVRRREAMDRSEDLHATEQRFQAELGDIGPDGPVAPEPADKADSLRAEFARLQGSAALLSHLTFSDGSVESDFYPGGVPRVDRQRDDGTWQLIVGWDDMRGPLSRQKGLDRETAIRELARAVGLELCAPQGWRERHGDWFEPKRRRVKFYGETIAWKDGHFWLWDGKSAKGRAITHAEARQIERRFKGYQVSMDIGKAGLAPDEAMAERGYVRDGDGQWTLPAYAVDGLVPRWEAELELFRRPRERVLLARWSGKAEHAQLEVYLDQGAEAAGLTFVEQTYSDAEGQGALTGAKVFFRDHLADRVDRRAVYGWICAALKEENLWYYHFDEEQVRLEAGSAKRRVYRLADFTRDARLTPEPNSSIVPQEPNRVVEFALGHVALSGGRVVCALLEEVMAYDSSAFSLYALSLEDYRQLLDGGMLDEAAWRRCARNRPICVTHSQNDGFHGFYSGPGPKPFFTEEEALPLAVPSEALGA